MVSFGVTETPKSLDVNLEALVLSNRPSISAPCLEVESRAGRRKPADEKLTESMHHGWRLIPSRKASNFTLL